jgi:hypothetical protein
MLAFPPTSYPKNALDAILVEPHRWRLGGRTLINTTAICREWNFGRGALAFEPARDQEAASAGGIFAKDY